MQRVPFLSAAANPDPDFIKRLVLQLQRQTFSPGDKLMVQAEIGDTMYFIASGFVIVYIDGNFARPITTLSQGSYIGEIALLDSVQDEDEHGEGGRRRHTRRSATIQAICFTEAFELARQDFASCLEDYPEMVAALKEVARERMRLTQAQKEKEKERSDSAISSAGPLPPTGAALGAAHYRALGSSAERRRSSLNSVASRVAAVGYTVGSKLRKSVCHSSIAPAPLENPPDGFNPMARRHSSVSALQKIAALRAISPPLHSPLALAGSNSCVCPDCGGGQRATRGGSRSCGGGISEGAAAAATRQHVHHPPSRSTSCTFNIMSTRGPLHGQGSEQRLEGGGGRPTGVPHGEAGVEPDELHAAMRAMPLPGVLIGSIRDSVECSEN